ncbi:MAG: LicD family protein [bacterium]|nr:LicD family protein [bacterium]
MFKTIFSVSNSKDKKNKIVTILGLKFKLKRRITHEQFLNYLNKFVDIKLVPKATGDLRKKQLLELHMMNDLKNICNNLGINFWLRGGTALGAYRHKGFIPWDDDVDLGLMRKDFDKLVEYVNLTSNKYKIIYYYGSVSKVAKLVFKNKVGGVWLDLFPYDWCEYEDENLYWKKWLNDKEKLQKELSFLFFRGGLFADEINEKLLNKIEVINEKYKNKYKDYTEKNAICSAIEQMCVANKKRVFSKNYIFPLRLIEFEKEKFYTVNNIEKYLELYYGNDYMQFPAHVTGHGIKFKKEDIQNLHYVFDKYVNIQGE